MLQEQLKIMDAAAAVLTESKERVEKVFASKKAVLDAGERESCEALTSRFARLCDFLFQRVFRTLDEIELQFEGTAIDRLNRMEKRGLITSAALWRELRNLRNEIAHDYLIETSDDVLKQSLAQAPELLDTAARVRQYVVAKGYSLQT